MKEKITKQSPREVTQARNRLEQASEEEKTLRQAVAWMNAVESPSNTMELTEELPPIQVIMGRLLKMHDRVMWRLTEALHLGRED